MDQKAGASHTSVDLSQQRKKNTARNENAAEKGQRWQDWPCSYSPTQPLPPWTPAQIRSTSYLIALGNTSGSTHPSRRSSVATRHLDC